MTIEKNKLNTEKNKKGGKFFIKFFFFILIFLVILVFVVLSHFSFKKTSILPEKEEINFNSTNEFESDLNYLKGKIQLLETQIENNENEINILKVKLEDVSIKSENHIIEPHKIETIKLILKIQNTFNSGESYKNDLDLLKILLKDTKTLNLQLEILSKYENFIFTQKNLINIFNQEMEEFLKENNVLSKNNSEFSKFISKLITIRKIENDKESPSDNFLNKLEKNIFERNYNDAVNIINSNAEYKKYFEKTEEELNIFEKVNQNIKEILKYLLNN